MLSVNQLSTLRWDFEQDVDAYAQHGYSGIGIYRPKLEDFGINRAVELLADYELKVTSLSWCGGFTGSDGRGYEEAVADAMFAVREAAALHADTLIVLPGGRNNHIRTHVRRMLCKALKQVSAVAEEFGISLAIEPFHPGCGEEWSFVNDLQSSLDIIERVDSPALGLALDTYHVGMDEETIGWLPDLAKYLKVVQIGDARHCPCGEMNRCLLGHGAIPNSQILEILREYDYQGPIEIELIGEDVEPVSYTRLLDHAKDYAEGLLNQVGA